MAIEITVLIAIGSFAIGFLGFWNKSKKEAEERAGDRTSTNMKLDHIDNGVRDIQVQVRNTDKRLDEINDRVIRGEESTRSAHKRLDRIEKKD